MLEPGSVVLGASSHNYQWTIVDGNVIRVEFPDIFLPDSLTDPAGSIGFFKYRVDQVPGNSFGDSIYNNAAIYFDFNPPIITNTTNNYIPFPLVVDPPSPAELTLYPNPGRELLTVQWSGDEDGEFELLNLHGQVVLRQAVQSGQARISTRELEAGVYLYRFRQNGQVHSSGKWLKL